MIDWLIMTTRLPIQWCVFFYYFYVWHYLIVSSRNAWILSFEWFLVQVSSSCGFLNYWIWLFLYVWLIYTVSAQNRFMFALIIIELKSNIYITMTYSTATEQQSGITVFTFIFYFFFIYAYNNIFFFGGKRLVIKFLEFNCCFKL